MAFFDEWLLLVRNCNVSNTYKMAWAKAITQIALEMDYSHLRSSNEVEITLKQIAQKVISYYWDQTIFFNLVQGSNPLKPPRILTLTKRLIEHYQLHAHSYQPVKFLRANVQELCGDAYVDTVHDVTQALKADVSYRFTKLAGHDVQGIFQYEKGADSLLMPVSNLAALRDNYVTVFEAINYRWAQILEDYNQSPRICKKVKIIDEQTVRRKPLKQFAQYLDVENKTHVCFLCGSEIVDETPAIDHVIPWSFLYSDDLWNLVYAHQSCNSAKSNVVPSEDVIREQEQRNVRLLQALKNNRVSDKNVSELQLAIERDLVKKFWIASQG
ncbi:HNH endonuclease [Alicyclobacillus curvatus]|nr:HNH endonuclease [Alicyclobacillus curvatus]